MFSRQNSGFKSKPITLKLDLFMSFEIFKGNVYLYNELFILFIITSTILRTIVLKIKNLVPKCAMVQNDKTSNDVK